MDTKKFKKLIAIDMDGTLLSDDKKISDETISYLSSLYDKDYLVVIASGRPYRAIKPFYEKMNLKSPVICYNGALVFDPNNPAYPKTRYMFKKDLVLNIIKEVGYDKFKNIMLENDKKIYIKNIDKDLDTFFHFQDMDVHHGDIRKILDNDCYICIFETEKDDELTNDTLVRASFAHDNIGVRFWSGNMWKNYSELYYLNVNKFVAIDNIRKYYHISKNDVIVFGDAHNDLQMLRGFDNSVVMKNAETDLLDDAKFISLADNNEDGVRITLQEMFDIN